MNERGRGGYLRGVGRGNNPSSHQRGARSGRENLFNQTLSAEQPQKRKRTMVHDTVFKQWLEGETAKRNEKMKKEGEERFLENQRKIQEEERREKEQKRKEEEERQKREEENDLKRMAEEMTRNKNPFFDAIQQEEELRQREPQGFYGAMPKEWYGGDEGDDDTAEGQPFIDHYSLDKPP
jgi:hypothetical protein